MPRDNKARTPSSIVEAVARSRMQLRAARALWVVLWAQISSLSSLLLLLMTLPWIDRFWELEEVGEVNVHSGIAFHELP